MARSASGDEGLRPGGLLALVASCPASTRDAPVLRVAPLDLSTERERAGQREGEGRMGEMHSLDRGHAGTCGADHGGGGESDLGQMAEGDESDTDGSGVVSEGAEPVPQLGSGQHS